MSILEFLPGWVPVDERGDATMSIKLTVSALGGQTLLNAYEVHMGDRVWKLIEEASRVVPCDQQIRALVPVQANACDDHETTGELIPSRTIAESGLQDGDVLNAVLEERPIHVKVVVVLRLQLCEENPDLFHIDEKHIEVDVCQDDTLLSALDKSIVYVANDYLTGRWSFGGLEIEGEVVHDEQPVRNLKSGSTVTAFINLH